MRSSSIHLELGLFLGLVGMLAVGCKPADEAMTSNDVRDEDRDEPVASDSAEPSALDEPTDDGDDDGEAAQPIGDASVLFDAGTMPPVFVPSTNPIRVEIEWSDARIADILDQVLRTAMQPAELASSVAQDEAVRSFATNTVAASNSTQNTLNVVLSEQGLSGEANAVSDELASRASSAMDELQGLAGRDFDLTYVDAQIELDADAYALISQRLMDNIQNERLVVAAQAIGAVLRNNIQAATDLEEQLSPPPEQ